MILVIAEKPSVAREIAKVVGANERKDGYLEGKGYLVSWCVGHLVALCDAAEYDEKFSKWRYEDLPIIPEEWKHKVLDGTKKQFGILKKLMNDPKTEMLVCATDAGREGELIFRLVYDQAGCRKPVKRLWISSMEEKSIRDGLEHMKDGAEYEALYQSALCRSEADWMVGINASRLFSVLYNKNIRVGRVQTPTLAMLVERNQKITEFRKEKYYVTHLKYMEMDAVSEHFSTREEAEQIAKDCDQRMCQVEEDEEKTKTVKAPKLYDLTTLQREANRMFGYTAQQTLDATQSLYEKKLVTYPRTDSQFLTEDMEQSTEMLVKLLMEGLPFIKDYSMEADIKKVLNSKKVSDHHAIIPTEESMKTDLNALKEKERNVFYLIAGKLLMAVSADYIYDSHKAILTCNHHKFSLSAVDVKQRGFKKLEEYFRTFAGKNKETDLSETDAGEINLYLSKVYGPCDTYVAEMFTQPPKQYTEDTLLSAMERAGNEELTEETEKKGIGTPATRAGIIEKLIQSGFVKREKKNLLPTEDGNKLITILPDEIKSPKMTAEWEMELNHIAQEKEDPDVFLQGITDMMKELTQRYQGISKEQNVQFSGKEKESIGTCPRCGNDIVEGKKNFYCTNKGCSFALWKNDKFFESQGKKMDKKTAEKLLKKGKIHYKDLVSKKSGKKYEATIIMNDPGDGYTQFQMEFPKKKG